MVKIVEIYIQFIKITKWNDLKNQCLNLQICGYNLTPINLQGTHPHRYSLLIHKLSIETVCGDVFVNIPPENS